MDRLRQLTDAIRADGYRFVEAAEMRGGGAFEFLDFRGFGVPVHRCFLQTRSW